MTLGLKRIKKVCGSIIARKKERERKYQIQKTNILPNKTKIAKFTPKFTLVVADPAFPGAPACPGVVEPPPVVGPRAEPGASEPVNLRTSLEAKFAAVEGCTPGVPLVTFPPICHTWFTLAAPAGTLTEVKIAMLPLLMDTARRSQYSKASLPSVRL